LSNIDFSPIDFEDSFNKEHQKQKISRMLGIFENSTKLKVSDGSDFTNKLYLAIPSSKNSSETKNVANYLQRISWSHEEGLLDQKKFDAITKCENQSAISIALHRLYLLKQKIRDGSVTMSDEEFNEISGQFFGTILDYAKKNPTNPDISHSITTVNLIAKEINPNLIK
ncbi:MAG: hypothetical protein RLZZ361_293, partial [Cyanobacteriota bacterium]